MGPSMRETTVILLSRSTISARNGYEFSFSACDTAVQTHLVQSDIRYKSTT